MAVTLDDIRAGGKAALARALAELERFPDASATVALLDGAYAEPRAHVVGMTSQVSDVVVTARHMRRLTLSHSVTAFAFNMLVLALSINVMAGAIQ